MNKIYPVIYSDGIVFNTRKDDRIISKCVYSVLGINMENQKDIYKKWTLPVRNWGVRMTQFLIFFEDRFAALCWWTLSLSSSEVYPPRGIRFREKQRLTAGVGAFLNVALFFCMGSISGSFDDKTIYTVYFSESYIHVGNVRPCAFYLS